MGIYKCLQNTVLRAPRAAVTSARASSQPRECKTLLGKQTQALVAIWCTALSTGR